MISVTTALDRILALVAPLDTEEIPLAEAPGRVLARDVVARRAQPPFDASAMDGYAVRAADAVAGATLRVVGEAAAGRRHPGALGPGEAVRIFTGAPVPDGADTVVIQEDTDHGRGSVSITVAPRPGAHIRAAGGDFGVGDRIGAPCRLSPAAIALAAAMDAPTLTVRRRPVVALLATGDELVMPGDGAGPDQIIASNGFGLKALLEETGAEARLLPVARDNPDSLRTAFGLAGGADLLVTIGGASVGDHDLVGPVARELGMDVAFHKVAMRPGKPLMAGTLGGTPMIGLPGNPVSAMVCGHVFICPAVRAMLGYPPGAAPRRRMALGCDLPANGPREHYMRATVAEGRVNPVPTQDSAMLSLLAAADALIVRAADDPARRAGDIVDILPL